jgi:hypothetical protein
MQDEVKPAALCAVEALDTMGPVPGIRGKKRGHTIPRVGWWCDGATERVDRAGLTHPQLAKLVGERFGYKVNPTGVLRCLSGDVLTLELAKHISSLLGMAPPIIEPKNEDEALALLGKLELARISAQVGVLKAGVGKNADSHQMVAISSDHGSKPKRREKR